MTPEQELKAIAKVVPECETFADFIRRMKLEEMMQAGKESDENAR